MILFARNIVSERQLAGLTSDLRAVLPEAFLCVDQEGGSVDRFRALTGSSPSFSAASRKGAASLAGTLAGEICAAFGIEWDLAPVVDRAVEGAGRTILKDRAASEDGEEIVSAAGAFLDSLAEFGVAGCLKHFPGLGRAAVDSHLVLPRLSAASEELERDLVPFRALVRRAPAVMVSHAAVGEGRQPATLDRAIASDLLRRDVGFEGIAISDDLEMGALAEFGDLAARSSAAFYAGCDFLCIGKENAVLPDAAAAVEAGASEERLDETGRRVATFRTGIARLKRERRVGPRRIPEIADAFRRATDRLA